MDLGIILGDCPLEISERDQFNGMLRQVEAAQQAGVNYIVIGQHYMFSGARWLQPVPVLARLAAEVDPSTRLCTQVLVGPLHHPVALGEELATLDVVTDGRLIVGLGLGYLPREYDVFGVPFTERGRRLSEIIEILRIMWSKDSLNYDGRHYQFRDVPVTTHPVQESGPPIWVGASGEAGVRRAARLGDGWPIRPQEKPEDLPGIVGAYYAARREAGRSPGLPVPLRREVMLGAGHQDALARARRLAGPYYATMATARADGRVDVIEDFWVLGSPDECVAQLRQISGSASVNPVITRANWPGMSADESVDYIRELGRNLVPALREVNPMAPR